MLDFPAFCGCTYQHIPAHDSMYLIVLLFEFSCTLLAHLKAAHLLQPYYKQFQAHPSLLLRRFHVAFPALPLPPIRPPPPLCQPFPERARGVAAAAAAASSASDAKAEPAPARARRRRRGRGRGGVGVGGGHVCRPFPERAGGVAAAAAGSASDAEAAPAPAPARAGRGRGRRRRRGGYVRPRLDFVM